MGMSVGQISIQLQRVTAAVDISDQIGAQSLLYRSRKIGASSFCQQDRTLFLPPLCDAPVSKIRVLLELGKKLVFTYSGEQRVKGN